MNTKTAIDTHSHSQGHTLTCSQAHTHLHSHAQGRHWALGPAHTDPVLQVAGLGAGLGAGLWATCGRGWGLWAGLWVGLWAGCGRGCGRGGAGTRQVLSNQPTDRVPGAGTEQGEQPRGTGPAGGSAHVGSAGLEGRQHVLELSVQKTDTSQAPMPEQRPQVGPRVKTS